jgi:hypothetical protein
MIMAIGQNCVFIMERRNMNNEAIGKGYRYTGKSVLHNVTGCCNSIIAVVIA